MDLRCCVPCRKATPVKESTLMLSYRKKKVMKKITQHNSYDGESYPQAVKMVIFVVKSAIFIKDVKLGLDRLLRQPQVAI